MKRVGLTWMVACVFLAAVLRVGVSWGDAGARAASTTDVSTTGTSAIGGEKTDTRATNIGATYNGASNSPSTLYLLHCSGCHGVEGMGEPQADVPPLPPYVGNFLRDPSGRQYVANVGGVTSSGLSAADTAAVLNWVMERFGGSSAPKDAAKFNAEEIRMLRAQRELDSVSLRRAIAGRLKRQGLTLADYPWP